MYYPIKLNLFTNIISGEDDILKNSTESFLTEY